jgi:hypothetical protein
VFDNSATAGGQQQPGGGHQATAQSSSPAVGFTSVGSSAAFTSTGGANPAAVANPNLTNKQVAAATPIVAYAQTIGVNVAQASNIKQLANGGVTYVAANGNTIEKVPGKAAYVIKAAPKPVSKQAR